MTRTRLVMFSWGMMMMIAVLALAGCGGTNSPKISQGSSNPAQGSSDRPCAGCITQPNGAQVPADDKLTVDKAGFGGNVSSGFQFWTAGALITNHSQKDIAHYVVVQATATDANGQVVGTGNQTVTSIHAAQTLPVAISLQTTAPVEKVTVLTAPQSWQPDTNPQATITGSGIKASPNDTQYILNATLKSTYTMDLTNVTVFAVCTDSAGNINNAAQANAPLLPAQGQVGIQFVQYGTTPTNCQIAGVPSS